MKNFLIIVLSILGFSAGSADAAGGDLPQCDAAAEVWTDCIGEFYNENYDNTYIGGWRENLRHGEGTVILSDGVRIIGDWEYGTYKVDEEDRLNNPGFRDIIPGMTYDEIIEASGCQIGNEETVLCYEDLENEFFAQYNSLGQLNYLQIKMGAIDTVNELEAYGSDLLSELYFNLFDTYSFEYGYTANDREAFNAGEKDFLYVMYEQGQVSLLIERNNDGVIEVFIEFKDWYSGQLSLALYRPEWSHPK